MKRLAIIPARGGSKRLPGKNFKRLNGKPLIYHSIDKALECFDRVIFTSDDEKMIKKVKRKYFFKKNLDIEERPEELSIDTSKVIDTVCYYFDQARYSKFDQIWLLLPTCPLRSGEDIINAQDSLTKDYDSILSITDYGFPPTLGLNRDDNGLISDFHDSKPWQNNNTRSQDHPDVFRPNGAIYGAWRESFSVHRNFYFGKVYGYYMPRDRSVDIDTELDFIIAESILRNNEYKRTSKIWPWIYSIDGS